MKILLKALIISFSLYCCNIAMLFLFSILNGDTNVTSKIIMATVYIFVFAFWAYYLLLLIYLFISASMGVRSKLFVAMGVMLVGYLLSRGGDIIDGDFKENFSLVVVFGFLASAFLVVGFDKLIDNWRANKKMV